MTKNLNGVQLDCYRADNAVDDFWATREQIGRLLDYAESNDAIRKIHERNKERLDRFSRVNQIDLPSGGTQIVTVYNFKGLLEICVTRISRRRMQSWISFGILRTKSGELEAITPFSPM